MTECSLYLYFSREICQTCKKTDPRYRIRVIAEFMFSPKKNLLKSNFLPFPKLRTIFWNAASKGNRKYWTAISSISAWWKKYIITGGGMLRDGREQLCYATDNVMCIQRFRQKKKWPNETNTALMKYVYMWIFCIAFLAISLHNC